MDDVTYKIKTVRSRLPEHLMWCSLILFAQFFSLFLFLSLVQSSASSFQLIKCNSAVWEKILTTTDKTSFNIERIYGSCKLHKKCSTTSTLSVDVQSCCVRVFFFFPLVLFHHVRWLVFDIRSLVISISDCLWWFVCAVKWSIGRWQCVRFQCFWALDYLSYARYRFLLLLFLGVWVFPRFICWNSERCS